MIKFIQSMAVATIGTIVLHLAACTSPGPPSPPIVQRPTGVYFITEYDAPGHVHRMWTVPTFTERDFPRSVTFETADGQTITLTGSYQIDEEAKR